MFVDMVMGRRIGGGQSPVLRPVFLKPHGIVRGTFTVRPDLAEELRVGVFAGDRYDAWIRFSSDTLPANPDLKSTCGIGIKLFGVPGPKLLPPDTEATTHDFLLQNHDVFFVDTLKDFCEFTYAGVVKGDYGPYLRAHPKTSKILDAMQHVVPSVLATDYWSGLPYAFGPDRRVKYKLSPAGRGGDPVPGLSTDDPDYLHADLRARLLEGVATFHFLVQFAVDDERTPLDRATKRWEETVSAPVHVATLTIPRQDVDAPGQAEYGEDLSFNTWHALAEHEPVGSIAQARRVVYQAAAERRRELNGVPLEEPADPRAIEVDPRGRDRTIVRAKIHPAIGIARVGNSRRDFFVGPEVDRPEPLAPGSYKDRTGALKRQAARFRVYGYNAAGEAVAELTPDNAEVEWSVHVANAKAAWYGFQIALDIPEARDPRQTPTTLRNADVTGADRASLTIDGGSRTISGANEHGPQYRFDGGTFMGEKVLLGELRTDEAGRLLFLGGHGVAASSDGSRLTDFANNDKWHDDVSDGPVTAQVTVDGRRIPVDPAWVITAPPNYGPDIVTVRTMYDLLYDAYVRCGWIPFPDRVSFTEHVLPILQRLANLQWVNHGFATKYGWGGREDFLDRAYLDKLASDSSEHHELRQQIWNAFRDWERDGVSPLPWPWIYGDSMSTQPPITVRQHITLSQTQLRLLERWAAGHFEADLDLDTPPPRAVDELPVSDQPEMLDRAALTFCLADAFHPGCEMTWPIRHTSMFMAPFRLRHRAIGDPEDSYGRTLTPDAVTVVDGPLYGQSPGSITRWMAVPWHGDTASCLSGYPMLGFERRYDPYLPTFWPARVPNDVLTERDYDIVVDESLPIGERRAAFERRAYWLRWLSRKYPQGINEMVTEFGKLGVIEARPGPADGAFPRVLHVESQVGWTHHVNPRRGRRVLHVPEAAGLEGAEADALLDAAVDAAPHDDEEYTVGYMRRVEPFGGRRA
ncbi:MAG TPA: LodA/GoxA family CTQ-dependent oxidase [Solirubrobacteraceae bacterium]|jgi:hypothetical protein